MKAPVRVALIGYGFLGKWHGQKVALLESQGLCKFSFIVDKSEKSRELAQLNHPSVRIEESLDKVWDQFDAALVGIRELPKGSRFGVYLAYKYYTNLFAKIKRANAARVKQERIRVNDSKKVYLLFSSAVKHSFNML